MHLGEQLGAGAGLAVQAVDVLGGQVTQPALPLEIDQGVVSGGGLRVHEPGVQPHPPGGTAGLVVGEVVLDRGGSLGSGVLGPQPVRTTEIRDPRIGRDARPGEHDYPLRRHEDPAGLADADILLPGSVFARAWTEARG